MSSSNPLAFFRRHQKGLMIVFGLVIILTFTVGGIVSRSLSPRGGSGASSNQTVMTWKNGEVTAADLHRLRQERRTVLVFLDRVVQRTQEAGGSPKGLWVTTGQDGRVQDPGIPRDLSSGGLIYTMLLAEKAKTEGLQISNADVLRFLQGLSDEMLTQKDYKTILEESAGAGYSDRQLFARLKIELMALHTRDMSRTGIEAVTPTMAWDYYKRLTRKIKLEVLPVKAEDYIDQVEAKPSDSELQDLYEKGKNRLPNESRPEPGFFRSVKLGFDYFKGDYEKFLNEAMAEVTPEEIQKYYDENKDKQFVKEPPAPKIEEPKESQETPAKPEDSENPKEEPAKPEDSENPKEEPAKPEDSENPKEEPVKPEEKPTESEKDNETSALKEETVFVRFLQGEDEKEPSKEEGEEKGQAGEPKAEEPKAEAPKAEEPKAEAPKAEEPKAKAPKTEEPKAEEPKAKAPKTEEPKAEAPKAEEPKAEAPKAEEPKAEAPKAEEPKAEAPKAEAPKEYKPLSEVEKEIRRSLAMEPAQTKMQSALAAARAEVESYRRQFNKWKYLGESEDSIKKPQEIDHQKIAEKYGLDADSIEPTDYYGIDKYELGQATRSSSAGGQFRSIPFAQIAYQQTLQNYKTDQIVKYGDDPQLYTEFVYWKVKEEDAYTPTFDQVSEEVNEFWVAQQAMKLAEKEAERLVKQSTEDQLLKTTVGEKLAPQVTETNEFSWYAMGFTATPRLSEVEGVEMAGDEFMKAASSLKPGEAAVAVNQPKNIAYVVRMISEARVEEQLREQFLAAFTGNDIYGMISMYMANNANQQVSQQWGEDLEKEFNVSWNSQAAQ